jgi:exopolysaccharide biosynthesis polyprenyl glycosylphosphotransferase
LIFGEGFRQPKILRVIKRVLDTGLALVVLILTLPLFILVAIAVRLESPGPVFYSQERVGRYNKTFHIYKFRSMVTDAEKSNSPVWAQKNDSRITRVGQFIRKTRLDELPQLWNILKGEMSFVGPRPERPVFVKELEEKIPFYSQRHIVKPGLTGWAQIRYEYGASIEDALKKLEYDLYYVKNMSIFLDIMTIMETVHVVLFRKGSR